MSYNYILYNMHAVYSINFLAKYPIVKALHIIFRKTHRIFFITGRGGGLITSYDDFDA